MLQMVGTFVTEQDTFDRLRRPTYESLMRDWFSDLVPEDFNDFCKSRNWDPSKVIVIWKERIRNAGK